MTSKGHPFALVNAFTQDTFAGNPAAVLFIDKLPPPETCQKIAANFNQPVTSFVSPSASLSSDESVVNFDICWNTATSQLPLCGHGTLAAAKTVLAQPGLVDTTRVRTINFKAPNGIVIPATRIEDDGEWFEITLPAAKISQLSPEETTRITSIVHRAAGQDDITVKFVGSGVGTSLDTATKVLIELDEKDDLARITFDPKIFLETGYEYNYLTTNCSNANDAVYLVRVFTPLLGVDEDPVCGSANCLTGPYWATKKGQGSLEMKVKQVSPRGGEFKVKSLQDVISLRGQVKAVASGELFL